MERPISSRNLHHPSSMKSAASFSPGSGSGPGPRPGSASAPVVPTALLARAAISPVSLVSGAGGLGSVPGAIPGAVPGAGTRARTVAGVARATATAAAALAVATAGPGTAAAPGPGSASAGAILVDLDLAVVDLVAVELLDRFLHVAAGGELDDPTKQQQKKAGGRQSFR